jgi:hypothetical protein
VRRSQPPENRRIRACESVRPEAVARGTTVAIGVASAAIGPRTTAAHPLPPASRGRVGNAKALAEPHQGLLLRRRSDGQVLAHLMLRSHVAPPRPGPPGTRGPPHGELDLGERSTASYPRVALRLAHGLLGALLPFGCNSRPPARLDALSGGTRTSPTRGTRTSPTRLDVLSRGTRTSPARLDALSRGARTSRASRDASRARRCARCSVPALKRRARHGERSP